MPLHIFPSQGFQTERANQKPLTREMSSIFDWEVSRWAMRERVKTRNDNGLRIWIFSQKLPFSVGKKMFQRQI